MEIPEKFTAFAPAKVNLYLKVLDKREDGFHNLESVFLTLNFGDTMYFQPIECENSIEITMRGINSLIPTEKNIIFKAISLFRQKTGFSKGFKITVDKRIPLGGGLGGGSSNAASTLLALNKLAGFPCASDALLEMAAFLGSDVPFFIHETAAALVTGRGERIQPIETPSVHLALVNPGFTSDTAAAFRLLDEHREREKNNTNDFLSIFPEKEKSVYDGIILKLKELGAEYANLSGSGATCFGVFNDSEQARKAADIMRGSWDFSMFCSPKQ
ncbi:MAG: 4-(cytidine 5'-diphospho)-2-C-methyl-D-erythritol kinase [Treponema sp.]|nr:4-(cytidine 5'-diphospho)-2-C-methyl-D-erythritol kinase [Treponema sp.]